MRRIISIACALACAFLGCTARADCFDDAALYQHVNADILRAVAWQESHFQPKIKHKNTNGSVDYGLMQINSVHLKRLRQYGISNDTLMDPCINIYVAAWHLREKMLKYGNTWTAVGAYHSENPTERDKYATRIQAIVTRSALAKRRRMAKPAVDSVAVRSNLYP